MLNLNFKKIEDAEYEKYYIFLAENQKGEEILTVGYKFLTLENEECFFYKEIMDFKNIKLTIKKYIELPFILNEDFLLNLNEFDFYELKDENLNIDLLKLGLTIKHFSTKVIFENLNEKHLLYIYDFIQKISNEKLNQVKSLIKESGIFFNNEQIKNFLNKNPYFVYELIKNGLEDTEVREYLNEKLTNINN